MRIPVHLRSFPSAPLQRPFDLFGKGLQAKLSSHLKMVPDVVLWIVTRSSWLAWGFPRVT